MRKMPPIEVTYACRLPPRQVARLQRHPPHADLSPGLPVANAIRKKGSVGGYEESHGGTRTLSPRLSFMHGASCVSLDGSRVDCHRATRISTDFPSRKRG